MYELNIMMWKMQQGARGVTTYYKELLVVWQELDFFDEEKWESPTDAILYQQTIKRNSIFVVLAGLNSDLDDVRGRLLGRRHMPICEVFAEDRSEESRRLVMLRKTAEPKIEGDHSAFAMRCDEVKKRGPSQNFGAMCVERTPTIMIIVGNCMGSLGIGRKVVDMNLRLEEIYRLFTVAILTKAQA